MRKILESILSTILESGIEAQIDDSDGTDTLRLIPDNIGSNKDGIIMIEVCKVPLPEVPNCGYYQIYTVIAKDLDEADYPRLLSEINKINLPTLLGHYGILTDGALLYHKFITRIPECSDKELENNLFGSICDAIAIVDNDYDRLFEVIDG
jgi:hypothetical protein